MMQVARRRPLGFACPVLMLSVASLPGQAPPQTRWSLAPPAAIEWHPAPGDTHRDEIEMSGEKVSVVLGYGVLEDGSPALDYHIVYPSLRRIPNQTSDSIDIRYTAAAEPRLFLDGKPLTNEHVQSVTLNGKATLRSTAGRASELDLERTVFPARTLPAVLARYRFTNTSAATVTVEVEETKNIAASSASRGVFGPYLLTEFVLDPGVRPLAPGASTTFTLIFSGTEAATPMPPVDGTAEEAARDRFVQSIVSELQLTTPDPILDTAFALAKIRTAESVFRTRGGLMPSPGGIDYYAAVWANDQAEYSAPFFPFLGEPNANAAILNTFRLFARYQNPKYDPIPSSIIAEGASSWSGAGGRGDMAMLAYGASRFALASGDMAIATELWPFVQWCLEYDRRHLSPEGVVLSASDELEGRFPHGKANLATSSLHFDALQSAVYLGRALGQSAATLQAYTAQATALRAAIAQYFAADVQGFATYRYSEQQTGVLRGWIGYPLTVGIYDRAQGTTAALFSPQLWGSDGDVVQSGNELFWDRATLYALRGAFAAGETSQALDHLRSYTIKRLLGEHVPYPVEAGPKPVGMARAYERHLAGESALYCRIYTEGLFGIRPTGLHAFTLSPHLPAGWDHMELRRIHAFGRTFDIAVMRTPQGSRIVVTQDGRQVFERIAGEGTSVDITLN